jgi:hypothetical protein
MTSLSPFAPALTQAVALSLMFYFFFSLISLYGHTKSKPFVSQDTHNQAGIAYNGGLLPLLKLLDSKNGSLQHNAAFALYGVADNEVIHDG